MFAVSVSRDNAIAKRNRARERRRAQRTSSPLLPVGAAPELRWSGHEKEHDQAERASALRAIKRAAMVYGRELARLRGVRLLELFGDSLEAELARRAVLLRLRRENPTVDFGTLDSLVSEMLER